MWVRDPSSRQLRRRGVGKEARVHTYLPTAITEDADDNRADIGDQVGLP